MIYAIDAYPMDQHAVYEAAPAIVEHSANGSAGFDAMDDAQASERIADARIHCIVSAAGHSVAVCDNGTLIALQEQGQGQPARLVRTIYSPPSRHALPATATVPSNPEPPALADNNITRRWFADLLLTFGLGFLLVSAFMFVTSRTPSPRRRYQAYGSTPQTKPL